MREPNVLLSLPKFHRSVTVIAMLLLVAMAVPVTFANAQQAPMERQRKAIDKVPPRYPDVAKTLRLSGTVRLSVKVAPNGKIISTEILGGHPVLAEAAVEAVRQWRYEPATQQTQENVTIDFQP